MRICTYPYVLEHRPSNQKIGAYQPDYRHLHGMGHSGCFCNDGLGWWGLDWHKYYGKHSCLYMFNLMWVHLWRSFSGFLTWKRFWKCTAQLFTDGVRMGSCPCLQSWVNGLSHGVQMTFRIGWTDRCWSPGMDTIQGECTHYKYRYRGFCLAGISRNHHGRKDCRIVLVSGVWGTGFIHWKWAQGRWLLYLSLESPKFPTIPVFAPTRFWLGFFWALNICKN